MGDFGTFSFYPTKNLGGFGEEGAAGDEASDIGGVGLVEKTDKLGGGGVEEGFVLQAGQVDGVFLEEAVEFGRVLLVLDAHGAHDELAEALDFAEEVVLADHGGGS